MFGKPTVFVLGAGASCDFGFPVGERLLAQIALGLSGVASVDEDPKSLKEWLDPIFNDQGAGKYTEELEWIAKSMHAFQSIDDFLYTHSDQKRAMDIGKASIARIISSYEKRCGLLDGVRAGKPWQRLDNTWMKHFVSMTVTGARAQNPDVIFDNLTVVNFNYDRSFEVALVCGLASAFNMTFPDACVLVKKLRILHPYGSLGDLRLENRGVMNFGIDGHFADRETRDAIKLYTETIVSPAVPIIQDAMARAKVIVFMGFGFHTQNMELLASGGLDDEKLVFATGYKLIADEIVDRRDRIVRYLKRAIVEMQNYDCADLLTKRRMAILG